MFACLQRSHLDETVDPRVHAQTHVAFVELGGLSTELPPLLLTHQSSSLRPYAYRPMARLPGPRTRAQFNKIRARFGIERLRFAWKSAAAA
jgi:hypothetical protein